MIHPMAMIPASFGNPSCISVDQTTAFWTPEKVEMRFASTIEEFQVYRLLPNEGRDPETLTWADCPTSDFLSVWNREVKDNKIKLHQVRPEFADDLHDLVHKVYQKGLKNKEARTVFARAFAWQHTPMALAHPAKFIVNWARFAWNRMQLSQRNTQKKTDMEEINLKNVAFAISSLEADLNVLNDALALLELELKEKQTELVSVNGILQGYDLAATSISLDIREIKNDLQSLKEICPDEDTALKQKSDEECALGLSLLTILKKKQEADIRPDIEAQIRRLSALITYKQEKQDDLKTKLANLQHLRSSFLTTTLIRPSPGNWTVVDDTSGCVVCGMAFSINFAMHVQLQCGHKFHLWCFQKCMQNLQCNVCNLELPTDLYSELGYVNFVPNVEDEEDTETVATKGTCSHINDEVVESPQKLPVKRRPQTRSMTSPLKGKEKQHKRLKKSQGENEGFAENEDADLEQRGLSVEDNTRGLEAKVTQIGEEIIGVEEVPPDEAPIEQEPPNEAPTEQEPPDQAPPHVKVGRKGVPKRFRPPNIFDAPATRQKQRKVKKPRVNQRKKKAANTEKPMDSQPTAPASMKKTSNATTIAAASTENTIGTGCSNQAESWNSSQIKKLWFPTQVADWPCTNQNPIGFTNFHASIHNFTSGSPLLHGTDPILPSVAAADEIQSPFHGHSSPLHDPDRIMPFATADEIQSPIRGGRSPLHVPDPIVPSATADEIQCPVRGGSPHLPANESDTESDEDGDMTLEQFTKNIGC